MVSAPATYCTSAQSRPASASATRAACTPYSTKLRPHLPHGCMPAPSTATRLDIGLPLPHQIVPVVLGIQHVKHELDRHADMQLVDTNPVYDLAHHDEPLGLQLDSGDRERLVWIGGRYVRRRRLVARVGVRPDAA